MALSDIRTALATGLATISGLNTADKAPAVVNPPHAFITLRLDNPVEYHLTGGYGTTCYHFMVTLLVQEAVISESQLNIDTYLLASGTSSIKAVIEAASLSTYADVAVVLRAQDYGVIIYNGINYLGCRFPVDVWVS